MLKTFTAASLLAVASLGLAACDDTPDDAVVEDTTAMEPAPIDTAAPLPGDTASPLPGDTTTPSPTDTASPTGTATPTM